MTRQYEFRKDEENIKSKKVAWYSFFIIFIITIFLAITCIKLFPLKYITSQIVFVENSQGFLNKTTTLRDYKKNHTLKPNQNLSSNQIKALNNYFINKYIRTFESFNFYSIQDDYAYIAIYSEPHILKLYEKNLENNKKIANESIGYLQGSIDTVINSITQENLPTPFKNKPSGGYTMNANVERQIRKYNSVISKQQGVIRITFGYDLSAKIDEKARFYNPLGLIITSYNFTPTTASYR